MVSYYVKFRFEFLLAAIVLLGLSLRLVYWSQLIVSPLFYGMVCDGEQLHHCALLLLRGETSPELICLNPVYPYFLALLYAVFGINQTAVAACQALLDCGSILLVYAIAARIFDRPAALAAAAFYAACGTAIFYSGLLLETTLVIACSLLAIWLILLFQATGRLRYPFLSGLAFAIMVLARANAVFILPFMPFLFLTQWGRKPWPRGIAASAVFFAGCLPIFLLFAWRNHHDYGMFSPFSVQGGINFYIGNNERADGMFKNPPGVSNAPYQQILSSVAVAAKATGHPMTLQQASSFWLAKGIAFLAENPGAAARLYLKKTAILLRGEEQPLNVCQQFSQSLVPLLRMPLISFGFLAPLALLRILAALMRKRHVLPILLFPLLYGASTMLFFVSSRYRMPIVPFAAIFAAYGLVVIASQIRRRDIRHAAASLIFILVTAVLVNARMTVFAHTCPSANDRRSLSIAYMRMGLYGEAVQQLKLIVGADPSDPSIPLNLTALLIAQQRYEEAETYGAAAVRLFPANHQLCCNLAAAYRGQDKHEQAKAYYQRAVELDATSVLALDGLADECHRDGEYEKAIACWEKMVALSPDRVDAANKIAMARKQMQSQQTP